MLSYDTMTCSRRSHTRTRQKRPQSTYVLARGVYIQSVRRYRSYVVVELYGSNINSCLPARLCVFWTLGDLCSSRL